VLPYSLSSVGHRADLGVQAVSPQVTWSHPPGGMLPLLSVRPAVTFPTEERHCPSVGTKLYCLVTEAHACEQLAQGRYLEADRPDSQPLGLQANALPLSHAVHYDINSQIKYDTVCMKNKAIWADFASRLQCLRHGHRLVHHMMNSIKHNIIWLIKRSTGHYVKTRRHSQNWKYLM